jgi:hypothetical protein
MTRVDVLVSPATKILKADSVELLTLVVVFNVVTVVLVDIRCEATVVGDSIVGVSDFDLNVDEIVVTKTTLNEAGAEVVTSYKSFVDIVAGEILVCGEDDVDDNSDELSTAETVANDEVDNCPVGLRVVDEVVLSSLVVGWVDGNIVVSAPVNGADDVWAAALN